MLGSISYVGSVMPNFRDARFHCSLEGDVFLDMTGDLLGDLFSRSGDSDGD